MQYYRLTILLVFIVVLIHNYKILRIFNISHFLKIVLACLLITSSMTFIFADFIISNGKIVNQNAGGNINFDLTDDGNSNITMTTNGSLGIGISNPASSLEIFGSFGMNTQIYTASGCITGNTIVLANTNSGNMTLTLPIASTVAGRIYQIKKTSEDFELTINASANIDKNTSIVLSTAASGYPFLNVYSSGTQWFISSVSSN